MTSLVCPRDQVVQIQKYTVKMAKVEVELQDNSLDSSADGELLGMVDEGSFDGEEKSHLVSQSFLDAGEETNAYNFKDLNTNGVTYRFVQMTGENPITTQNAGSPGGDFYVISDPMNVFETTAAPKKAIKRDPIQAKAMTTKKRDDKRRATHNEVERRRRDKINSWITKLAALIPNSGLPDSTSKGGILAKACDHITELTDKQKRFDKMELDNERLVSEVLKLNQELSEMRKENTYLRGQLVENNCIVVKAKNKS